MARGISGMQEKHAPGRSLHRLLSPERGRAVSAAVSIVPAAVTRSRASTKNGLSLHCAICAAARRCRDLPGRICTSLSLTSLSAQFTGVTNFVKAWQDPEFLPALEHVAIFLAIWLGAMVVFVVGLSLMLHSLDRRISAGFRFVLYLPAALAGSASVMLWLFMLQPGESPWSFVLHWLGYHRSATRSRPRTCRWSSR